VATPVGQDASWLTASAADKNGSCKLGFDRCHRHQRRYSPLSEIGFSEAPQNNKVVHER
jgi:hypothetical protein